MSEAELARLLGSGSAMLVMAHDVLQRCPPPADELQTMRAEPLWAQLRVAEQVEAMMSAAGRGSKSSGGDGRAAGGTMAVEEAGGKLRIPASYTPGFTLIAPAGSAAAQRMGHPRGRGGGAEEGAPVVPWRYESAANAVQTGS